MTPRAYLLDRLPLLLSFGVALLLLLLVVHLGLAPLTISEVGYIALLAVVMAALILGVDFLRHRSFRREVALRLSHGDAGNLSPLPRPASREQRAMAELLTGAQRDLQAELQQHKSSVEQHRAFVDLWVHQMKTPLAVLELTAQQELDAKLTEERRDDSGSSRGEDEPREAWSSVAEEVDQLANGLDLMLTTARLERFDLDLKPALVDLAAAAREAVNDLKRTWIRTGVYPRVQVREQTPERATGQAADQAPEQVTGQSPEQATDQAANVAVGAESDPKWLQVVLRQLLTNAIKYSAKGQQVSVTVAQLAGCAVITVTDQGIGIPPEDVPRVFERFYTGANGRRGQASTGMGLFLAAEICRRLGHTLDLTSTPGGGTTVTLSIRPQGVHRI